MASSGPPLHRPLAFGGLAAGERWAQEIANELEASNFGIICVTPENLEAPWLIFEAGALAKSMQGARVVPLLFNLEFSDISGPLAQFQAKKVEKAGIGEVVVSINQGAGDEAIPEDRSRQLFTALWPELESKLESIPTKAPSQKHTRPQREVLEEMVAGVRGLDARFRELEEAVSRRTPRLSRRRSGRLHPMVFEELIHMSESPGDPVAILMAASFIRDDLPWLYELAMDVYRTAKTGNREDIERELLRLHRLSDIMVHSPLADELNIRDNESRMMAVELPRILQHMLRHTFENQVDRTSKKRSVNPKLPRFEE